MFFKNLTSAFYQEASILKVSDIVQWKKQNNRYNFKSLPSTLIINANIRHFNIKTQLLSKRIKGIAGKNYILNKDLMITSGFGNGAPALLTLLEELKSLGVKSFIFIGFSGIISKNINEGEIYNINNAFSCNGCSSLYLDNDSDYNYTPKKNEWYQNIRLKTAYKETSCVSTDAPFRETQSFIDYYTKKGVSLVDMECAAMYVFAKFYNLNSMCLLIASDNLLNGIWNPPRNMKFLNQKLRSAVRNLAKCL